MDENLSLTPDASPLPSPVSTGEEKGERTSWKNPFRWKTRQQLSDEVRFERRKICANTHPRAYRVCKFLKTLEFDKLISFSLACLCLLCSATTSVRMNGLPVPLSLPNILLYMTILVVSLAIVFAPAYSRTRKSTRIGEFCNTVRRRQSWIFFLIWVASWATQVSVFMLCVAAVILAIYEALLLFFVRVVVVSLFFARFTLRQAIFFVLGVNVMASLIVTLPGYFITFPILGLIGLILYSLNYVLSQDPLGENHVPEFLHRRIAGQISRKQIPEPRDRGIGASPMNL